MPITVGETFERYAIESLIGRGGVGEVYRAVDTRLRRKVALKVLRPDRGSAEAVSRLFREARSAAVLTHPNTVAIHDIGESEGIFYIVMELVTGFPLLRYVGDAAVPVARKLGWLVDIARALSAAHKAGVVHRDVKPSNVMVSDDGVIKVLDFGLAKPRDPVSFRTQQGHVLGTPRYMAPEQLAGADVDTQTDQYSYGVLAYELLAGQHPGGAIVTTTPPPRLDLVTTDVPSSVARVIERTLATSPAERFAAMDDVATALEDAIAGRPVRALATESTADTVRFEVTTDSAVVSTVSSPVLEAAVDAELAVPGADVQTSTGPSPAELGKTLVSRHAPSGLARLAAPAAAPLPPALVKTAPLGLIAPVPAAALAPGPPAPQEPLAQPATRSRLPLVLGALVVVGLCAFAGAYYGSRALTHRDAVPASAGHDPKPKD